MLILDNDTAAFYWSDERHRCSHNMVAAAIDGSTVDGSCAALSYFSGMFYSPIINLLVSPRFRTAIPFSQLQHFLKTKEKVALKFALSSNHITLDLLLEHFSSVFQIDLEQTVESATQELSGLELHYPIPTLAEPVQAIRCTGCLGWYNSSNNRWLGGIKAHWYYSNSTCPKLPPLQERDNPPRRWTLPLFQGLLGKQLLSARVPMVPSWNPQGYTPIYARNEDVVVTYSAPEWISDLGWQDYMESLNARPSALLQLISLPSEQTVNSWPDDSTGHLVESGLCVVHEFMRSYLIRADKLVNQSHPSLRGIITAG
jgi:hypothetical protein